MAHDLRPFIKHATTFQAQLISPLSHGRGNFKGEGKYRAYYDDIVASKQLWMAFFDDTEGNPLALMSEVRPAPDAPPPPTDSR